MDVLDECETSASICIAELISDVGHVQQCTSDAVQKARREGQANLEELVGSAREKTNAMIARAA